MAEDESEYLKLPVEDRCIHKLWKARVSGYEEAKKLFVGWDEDDDKWKKFSGIIKKMVTDSNAVAQEKGLEVVLLYAENCKAATRTAGEVIDGLVTKCVAAPKTKTKELATQIMLMYCEIETHEKIVDGLISGLAQKNPKIVSAVIKNITEILRSFGAKVIKISPLLKAVIPFLDHRDKDVREESKKLIIESYRWIGDLMKSQLTGVKPLQMSELETEFEKVGSAGQPRAERWLRSAGPPKEAKVVSGEGGGEEEEEDEDDQQNEGLDPYEMLDPVEILSKLPKNFYEQVEEKKWQLRKEMLDALLPLTQNPKLQPGDYHDLVKVLKKFIAKDTNVMLVALAAQCMAGLAKGLRTSFKSMANNSLSTLLEKFKEKKVMVVAALKEAVDAFYPILGIEAMQEDILAALKHKTPTVKSETAFFLARCFAQCPPILATNKKVLKGYISALLETLNESDPGVREGSAEALGALLKFLGEGKVFPLMPDLDNLKQEKIKEKAEKIELSGKKAPGAKTAAKPAAAKPGPRVVKPEAAKEAAAPPAATAKKPVKKVVKSGGGAGGAKKAGAKAPAAAVDKGPGVGSEPDMSLEEAESRVDEIFNAEILSGLGDANWKNRLAAMESAKGLLSAAPDTMPGLVALKLLCKKPGLKENNFQVLGLKLGAISTIAGKVGWTQQGWDTIYPDIVDKLSDKKNLDNAKNCLYDIAESCSFNFVFTNLVEGAFNQKNPVVKAESLNWCSEGIRLFGLGGVSPKTPLDAVKKGLNETNPAIRTAAIALLGVVHWYIGATARRMFEDEKPAVLTQIDNECNKYSGQATPAPTRGVKASQGGAGAPGGGEEGDDEGTGAEMPIEDLVPRKSIAPQLTDELLEMIKDKNWKIRKEGLDKLKEIVNSAKFITNDLAGLPAALGPRTTDANKILVVQALELVSELVLAMGPQTRAQIPQLLPAVMAALADSKTNVRAAAVATLNTFIKETSLKDLFVNEIISTALTKGNPNVKMEIWTWLTASLPQAKGLPKDELTACLAVLYASIEDRSADVRKPANEAVLPLMKHLGYEPMRKATDKLSAVSKNTVSPLLEKARAELPPPPAAAPKAAAGGPKAVKPRAATAPASSAAATEAETKAPAAAGKPESKSAKPAAAKSRLGLNKPAGGGKKSGEDVDTSPLYQPNKLKNQRFKDETKLKVLKWNFSVPRAEFVDQLKDQVTAANFNKSLFAMMFHADFKQHLKALDMLLEYSSSDVDGLISNLDLLLKWMTLRFFETNPSVNIKGLEYLVVVFTLLSEVEEGYMLHELEATAFLPYLINKMGDPKDNIRSCCRNILRLICQLYPASKLFPHLMTGLGTKNAKQRAECLEEIGLHIKKMGVSVCGAQPAASLKEIAKQIADRDVGVRNAALNAVTEAYFKEGETKLYKMIGNIPDKDMAMLEERIKRSSKNRPVEPEAIGQPSDPPSRKASSTGKPGQQKTSMMRPPSSGRDPDQQPPQAADLKQRLMQARTNGSGLARPVSGAFSLDLDKIESKTERMSDIGPKLIEHNLEDIMNSEPIMLPVTRTGMQRMMSPEHNHPRNNQQEAHQAVTTVIAQIISTDTQTSIAALADIDEVLKNREKADLIGPCIDHLFTMCSMQYRYVLETKLKDSSINEKDSLRLLQYLTMVLMSVYGHRELVRKASMQVLHDLLHMIILILLEPAVANLPEGGQLVRALNVLTVKIVDRSDHNNVSIALVRLLHACVGSSQLSNKYCVLVMKCLWKVIRGLPQWLESMDVSSLLVVLHEFLKSFPSSYGKTMEDDTPLRTVKTVIHTLVKVLGDEVLSCLGKISDPQNSELVAYVKKLVAMNGVDGSGLPVSSSKPQSAKKAPRFSKSDHETLAEIFKKIGQKELSKLGLQELYNFKQQNPEADLEPFLAKSSTYFREYIERGLRNVEQEVKSGGVTGGPPAATAAPAARGSVLSDSNTAGQPAHLVYLERLKRLRAAGGLETTDQENVENLRKNLPSSASSAQETGASSGYSSGVNSAYSRNANNYTTSDVTCQSNQVDGSGGPAEQTTADSSSSSSVDDIRKRLAKIKQAAF